MDELVLSGKPRLKQSKAKQGNATQGNATQASAQTDVN